MTASDHALDLATLAARAASGKLASNVVAIDVSDHLVITDVFVLASAPNERQVRSIVEGVEEALNAIGVKPIRREGERDGRWVLLDFGELVVHVQHAEERSYYSLERLWKDCPTVPLPDDVVAANAARTEFANEAPAEFVYDADPASDPAYAAVSAAVGSPAKDSDSADDSASAGGAAGASAGAGGSTAAGIGSDDALGSASADVVDSSAAAGSVSAGSDDSDDSDDLDDEVSFDSAVSGVPGSTGA